MTAAHIPELQAERVSNLQWRVWCRFCKCHHFHGATPGHRVAHCTRETPYTATGYSLLAPIDPDPLGLEGYPR